MRLKNFVIVGLVLWVWSAAPVFAQEQRKLQHVDKQSIGLFIEDLRENENARGCSIFGPGLDAAVRLPLSRNGFRFNSTSQNYVSVLVTALKLPGGCIANVTLRFNRLLQLNSRFWGIYQMPGTTVWEVSALLTGTPYDMATRVNDELENITNELIAKWLIDNPQ